EAVDRFGVPDDELARAAGLVDHGGTVARLAGAQRPPDLLAGVLVEGDGGRALAAHHAEELLAVEKGVRREAPYRRTDLVVLFQLARPEDLAGLRVETEQVPFRAQGVDFLVLHEGGRARAQRVGDGVGAIVFVLPQDFAI